MTENVKCPVCGGPMTSRRNRVSGQRFWGCDLFPLCRGTLNTDGEAPRARAHERSESRPLEDALPSERRRRNDRERWRA